ncbi:PREDICTED: zinc finger protein 3 isoform X2 [Papilio polytes]|uniref:zinc finger protein 3 isoform X2 n=1 Tax=Papilio polytes TaxID=76194 RepID=UPI000676AB25|nr:PREDICTED: zinc finger protein 3 isoform X2 [Papilio polytes]XP_013135718.1 PREDICTED: zinc finger protein 3 isoform X2 [Papilio polytes]
MNNNTEQVFIINHSQEFETKDESELGTGQINLENIEDFTNVCRTCAAVTEFVVPIFIGEGLQNKLADKIHKYLPIQVSEEDVLPQVVCYQCVSTLISWHDLVQNCTQADTALNNKLSELLQDSTSKIHDRIYEIRTKGKWTPSSANCENTYRSRIINENEINDTNKNIKSDTLSASAESVSDVSDNDDRPLAAIASEQSNDLYRNVYNALLNFRNHYVAEHDRNTSDYPDFSDSSDSEVIQDTRSDEDGDINNFDDLTEWNMRKGKMDEETRLELNEVQRKVDGKVFFACKICDKNLSTMHTYIFHKRIHTGERPCVCHVCGKQFRTPNGLQRHLTETHQRLRRHSCSFCPKNFANTQNLKQHLRIHTGERPFVCSHCGKRFTQSGSLHVHLKTHSEQYPFHCAECGAKFRLRSGLTRHRLKHTGERPHACLHCGKAFRQKHDLHSHALAHTNPKPHACLLCGAAFRQQRALKHHYKRVHQSEPPKQLVNEPLFNHVGQYQ